MENSLHGPGLSNENGKVPRYLLSFVGILSCPQLILQGRRAKLKGGLKVFILSISVILGRPYRSYALRLDRLTTLLYLKEQFGLIKHVFATVIVFGVVLFCIGNMSTTTFFEKPIEPEASDLLPIRLAERLIGRRWLVTSR